MMREGQPEAQSARSFSGLLRAAPRAFDRRPIWAQLNITSRCNGDGTGPAGDGAKEDIPFEDLVARIERCRALGVKHADLVGGEPLLYPGLDGLLAEIGGREMTSGIITDGVLLTVARVDSLVDAGLRRLQLTVDGAQPNGEMLKPLGTLEEKIQCCAELPIWFRVHVVLCEETLSRLEAAARFCFELDVGVHISLVHDKSRLRHVHDDRYLEVVRWLRSEKQAGRSVVTPYYLLDYYERALTGAPPDWTCRAGQKCFYVAADGNFHYCAHVPAAGRFADVTENDLARLGGPKGCERNCGVECVLQTSLPFSNVGTVMASELGGRLSAIRAGVRNRLPVLSGAS